MGLTENIRVTKVVALVVSVTSLRNATLGPDSDDLCYELVRGEVHEVMILEVSDHSSFALVILDNSGGEVMFAAVLILLDDLFQLAGDHAGNIGEYFTEAHTALAVWAFSDVDVLADIVQDLLVQLVYDLGRPPSDLVADQVDILLPIVEHHKVLLELRDVLVELEYLLAFFRGLAALSDLVLVVNVELV